MIEQIFQVFLLVFSVYISVLSDRKSFSTIMDKDGWKIWSDSHSKITHSTPKLQNPISTIMIIFINCYFDLRYISFAWIIIFPPFIF